MSVCNVRHPHLGCHAFVSKLSYEPQTPKVYSAPESTHVG